MHYPGSTSDGVTVVLLQLRIFNLMLLIWYVGLKSMVGKWNLSITINSEPNLLQAGFA